MSLSHSISFSLDLRRIIMSFAASSSKSQSSLLHVLGDASFPVENAGVQTFATELFARAPRGSGSSARSKTSAAELRKAQDKEAADLQRQRFSLMLDDDGAASSGVADRTGSKRDKKGKGKDREKEREKDGRSSKHRKREAEGDWDSDEEERERKRRRDRDRYSDDDTRRRRSEDRSPSLKPEPTEEDEQEDVKAFEKRLRDRDKGKTKTLVEDHSATATANLVSSGNVEMSELRIASRRAYLSKRELQQTELLKQNILDFELDTRGVRLTKKEERELQDMKDTLRLIEERHKIDDYTDGYYQMPDDYFDAEGKLDKKRKNDVLLKRYEDPKSRQKREQESFVTDIDLHEREQTQKAIIKSGALDRQYIEEETYDYVFDEEATIKFVAGELKKPSKLNSKDEALLAQMDQAEEKGGWFAASSVRYRPNNKFPTSQIDPGGPKVVAGVQVAGPVARSRRESPSSHHCRRDRIG